MAGDQIRQQDDGRWTFGADFRHGEKARWFGKDHTWTVGTQLRGDVADVTLSRTRQREVVSLVRNDLVSQYSGGLFLEVESRWTDLFRSTLGLRGDLYAFDVVADDSRNTGTADDGIVSLKASLIFGPWADTEFYVRGGYGFHSNDARGTVTTIDPASSEAADPVDPLVRSVGAEVGVQTSFLEGLRSTVTLWTVELDSKLLLVGGRRDDGAQRRQHPGRADRGDFYRFAPGWSADLDVSFTRARFPDVAEGEDRIPGATENVLAAGLNYDKGENGLLGSLRLRRFGTYPLIEDPSVRAQAHCHPAEPRQVRVQLSGGCERSPSSPAAACAARRSRKGAAGGFRYRSRGSGAIRLPALRSTVVLRRRLPGDSVFAIIRYES